MILLQEQQVVKEGLSAFEKISNPILILLLVVLLLGLYFSYKYFTKLITSLQENIIAKDKRIEEQHNLLVQVRTSDAEMIIELKNTLEKFVDTDKSYSERLGYNNELLQQLIIKADILLKINNK